MRSKTGRPGPSDQQKEEIIAALGKCRHAMIAVRICSKINAPLYEAAGTVTRAIDAFMEALTGDREHFWQKGHDRVSKG